MWLFLRDHTDLFIRPQRVLHIAPELMVQNRLGALTHLDYISGDLSIPYDGRQIDVTDLPFADGFFDVVICSHVFEHVSDDLKAMSELCRVLAPDGWGILDASVRFDQDVTFEDPAVMSEVDRPRGFGQNDRVRIYGRDYLDRLRRAGWDVQVDPVSYSPAQVARYGLAGHGHIYYCTHNPAGASH